MSTHARHFGGQSNEATRARHVGHVQIGTDGERSTNEEITTWGAFYRSNLSSDSLRSPRGRPGCWIGASTSCRSLGRCGTHQSTVTVRSDRVLHLRNGGGIVGNNCWVLPSWRTRRNFPLGSCFRISSKRRPLGEFVGDVYATGQYRSGIRDRSQIGAGDHQRSGPSNLLCTRGSTRRSLCTISARPGGLRTGRTPTTSNRSTISFCRNAAIICAAKCQRGAGGGPVAS